MKTHHIPLTMAFVSFFAACWFGSALLMAMAAFFMAGAAYERSLE